MKVSCQSCKSVLNIDDKKIGRRRADQMSLLSIRLPVKPLNRS